MARDHRRLMQPSAAVVVATYNRASYLDRLLDALAAQDDAPSFEVIVVDDASTDRTPALLEARTGAATAFALVTIRQKQNRGPATARNRGWQATKAPVICFTDDDCIPSPTWLAALVSALGDGFDVAQGRTEPVVAQRPERGPFSMTIERLSENGFYETCNIAYRRDWLERLDGFDEDFRFPFGEDTDLAWRARKAGATTTFVDSAVVEHEIWPFRWKSRLGDIRRREGINLLLRKHPELRTLFPSRWFQKRTHSRGLLVAGAVTGLVLQPRSRWSWLAALSAVRAYYVVVKPERQNVRRRDWPWILPLCFASDMADVAALARGSVRQRAFFL
jgi:GT2 family glycosyltransferase